MKRYDTENRQKAHRRSQYDKSVRQQREKKPYNHHRARNRYPGTNEPMPEIPASEKAIDIYRWIMDDGLEDDRMDELILKPLMKNDLMAAAAGVKSIMDINPSKKVSGYLREIWYAISDGMTDKQV